MRSRFLLVMGLTLAMLGGSNLVTARPRVETAATIYTRVVSCPGVGFLPTIGGVSYSTAGLGRTMNSYNTTDFDCAVALPAGARVSRVAFALHDGSLYTQVGPCRLLRGPLVPSIADRNPQEMASVDPTGYDETPGYVRYVDTSIAFALVEPARYAYALRCRIGVSQPGGNLSQASIDGAAISYRISAANG